MSDGKHIEEGEHQKCLPERLENPDTQSSRQACAADMASVEKNRTNSSDGSLRKYSAANLSDQEQSIEIVFGDGTSSRTNKRTEREMLLELANQPAAEEMQPLPSPGIGRSEQLLGHTEQPTGQTTDTDYAMQKLGANSFALGVNRQVSSETRTPAEMLQDFMRAAAKRSGNREGWKAWAQGEINKFAGIAEGLNEAKEETKSAVAFGWKAMTDGTVVEFLSQPNAINSPAFKIVENAFEAMSKDPDAANKAFETLGKIIMSASEGYNNLPDHEKGKVVGKIMFGMVNPEGNTGGAEAAVKIGDHVAAQAEKLTLQAAERPLKAIDELGAPNPKISRPDNQMHYDIFKSGEVSGDKPNEIGKISNGHFEPLAGKGGDWPVLNERNSGDVVQQLERYSCVSACGEMLTNGEFTQTMLIDRLGTPANTKSLAEIVGPPWKGNNVTEESLDGLLNRKSPWAAELRELPGPKYSRIDLAHTVVVDGVDKHGNIMIRDPADGTRYEMTRADFLKHWNGTALYR